MRSRCADSAFLVTGSGAWFKFLWNVRMDIIEIQYCFKVEEGRQENFEVRLDAKSLDLVSKPTKDLPAWTRLGVHQCPHCPLHADDHPFCPVAASLVDVVKRFDRVISYDQVEVEVITKTRRVSQRTSAQRGISSLLGLLFPTSGCPHTAFFKPMVRFHLPMSTEEDTIFRATGMYLIAQYFLRKDGKVGDLELAGLKKIYTNMHLVNTKITERLRIASRVDSSINAVILLDVFTHAIPFVIEEQLEEIRHLFAPYLSDFYDRIINDDQSFE